MIREPPRSPLFPYPPLFRSADSGFYSSTVVNWCEGEKAVFGITADQTEPLRKKIEELEEAEWEDLERYGVAQVSELRYQPMGWADRKSTRLNSSHANISYAVFCLKKKRNSQHHNARNDN